MVRISLISAIVVAVLAGAAEAQPTCDPALVGESKNPLSYRMRGDRCEGIYAQEVSAISLDVRSLVGPLGSFDPARNAELALEWAAPPGATTPVRLRAFSLKERQYFRMDTAVPASRGSYLWPTEVVARVGLKKEEIGLVAWASLPGPGGSAREVYLPVRAGRAAAGEPGYEVTIVPSARLREVRISLSRIDGNGDSTDLRRDEELGFGYYPSGQPMTFSTRKLGPAGFYRLEISAIPFSGRPVTEKIEIYHAGD